MFTARANTAYAEPPARSDTQNYEFEDDLVRGDTNAATGEILQVRTRKAKSSLIRVREHFLAELYKSVEKP